MRSWWARAWLSAGTRGRRLPILSRRVRTRRYGRTEEAVLDRNADVGGADVGRPIVRPLRPLRRAAGARGAHVGARGTHRRLRVCQDRPRVPGGAHQAATRV